MYVFGNKHPYPASHHSSLVLLWEGENTRGYRVETKAPTDSTSREWGEVLLWAGGQQCESLLVGDPQKEYFCRDCWPAVIDLSVWTV